MMFAQKKLLKPLGYLHNNKYRNGNDTVNSSADNRTKHQRKISHTKNSLQDVELKDLNRVATLGIGGFARVELVTLQKGERLRSFALKKVKKSMLTDTKDKYRIISESCILGLANNPFIVSLYATLEDKHSVYFLTEACLGGELWTLLRDRVYFSDSTVRFYAACVMSALEYLHNNQIVYRDIKPENLLLANNGYLKLVDFGLAKQMKETDRTYSFCGTPEYISPEVILEKGHSYATDFWSLGVLIAEMVSGEPPFRGENIQAIYDQIIRGIEKISFPRNVSYRATQIISKLCKPKPNERLGGNGRGVNQIRHDIWFQSFDWEALSNLTLRPPISPKVENELDTSNFDNFPPEANNVSPQDELSAQNEEDWSGFDEETNQPEMEQNKNNETESQNNKNSRVEEIDVGIDVILMMNQMSLSGQYMRESQYLLMNRTQQISPYQQWTNNNKSSPYQQWTNNNKSSPYQQWTNNKSPPYQQKEHK